MKFGRVGNAGFFVVGFDSCVKSASGTNCVAAGKHHFFKDDDFLAAGFFCRDGSRKTGTAGPNHDDVVGVIPIDSGFSSRAEECSENTGSGSSCRSGTKEYST